MLLLLVENDQRLSEALSHILKKQGYTVDVAPDGETGLEMAATGVYDLLVLDRMLPRRDGLSVLREFRRLGLAAPVLFLTAKDTPGDRVEGLDCGPTIISSNPLRPKNCSPVSGRWPAARRRS